MHWRQLRSEGLEEEPVGWGVQNTYCFSTIQKECLIEMANISIYVWDQLKPPHSNFSSEDFAHENTNLYSRAEKTIEF